MTLFQRNETVRDFNGVVVSKASVKVVAGLTYDDSAPLAVLYSDPAGLVPLANPMQADAAGTYSYWVDTADYYSEQISRPGYISTTNEGFFLGTLEGPPGPQGSEGRAGPDLSPQLASTANASYGAGMIGLNTALAYAANTVGKFLKDLATSGSSGIGYLAPMTGAVTRFVSDRLFDRVSVFDFMTTAEIADVRSGAGVLDIQPALQAALDAMASAGGGCLRIPKGVYTIGSGLVMSSDDIQLLGDGPGVSVIKAKDGTTFEFMLYATAQEKVGISKLTFDVNKSGRSFALQAAVARACGPVFDSCNDAFASECEFKNAYGKGGGSPVPAVCFAFGGNGLRNKILNCVAIDGGDPGYSADGFYTSGTQTLIYGCQAKNCLDTGFVLENSNYSGIIGCTADGCSDGAAITALSSDSTGNFISGMTVNGWSSSVTGGVQIGALGAGNLLDTSIDGLVMTGGGTGPALNFRKTSTGRIIGTTVRAKINGASTQGILVDGCDELVIASGTSVKGTGGACVQVQTGCTKIVVDGAQLNPTGPNTFGFTSMDGTDITVKSCQINATAGQMTYGIYFFGTGTRCSAILNNINGHSVAAVGADATTTPIVVAPMTTASGFYFGKASITNLYDLSGVLKTDQAFISSLTIKALGNLIEVGPTGVSSGNGGSFRARNDTGTSSWLMGHLGSGGATAWVLNDVVAADSPVTVNQGVAGSIDLGGANKRAVNTQGHARYTGKAFTANGATTTFTYPVNTRYQYITTSAVSLNTTLPATSAALDGMVITFVAGSAVVAATWTAGTGGATIVGAPAALVANTPVRFIYHHATTSWYPY
jgi:hypothetical protein